MARSNNDLNTGFCPRADRDNIELFTAGLTFSPQSAEDILPESTPSERDSDGKTEEYPPGMSELNMMKTALHDGSTETIESINGPSELFVTSGGRTLTAETESYELKEGFVYFAGQGVETEYEAENELIVCRAHAE